MYTCIYMQIDTYAYTHPHAYSMTAIIVQWKVMNWKLKHLGSSYISNHNCLPRWVISAKSFNFSELCFIICRVRRLD